MRQFEIEDDVVALALELAKPEPFETLSSALRRLLTEVRQGTRGTLSMPTSEKSVPHEGRLNTKPSADRIRASTPDPRLWVSQVPELRSISRLNSWQAICDHLKIQVGMDSARRKLRDWVKRNRPNWAPVPDA
jgi:hypothetical protein